MILNGFIILIAPLLLSFYMYVKKKYLYWKDKNILYQKPSFPMGNLQGMGTIRHPADINQELYMKFRGRDVICGSYFFTQPVALALDLELVKNILVRDFNQFHDRGFYYNERDDPLTANLFSLAGSKWKKLRNKLSPTFTQGKMKIMFPILLQVSELLMETLKVQATCGIEIDIKDIVSRFSTDVIVSTAFGIDCRSLTDPQTEFRINGKRVFEAPPIQMLIQFFCNAFPKLSRYLRLKLFPESVTKFFIDAVEQTVNYRRSNTVQRKDFMQMLIELQNIEHQTNKTDYKKHLNELASEAFIFFLAGFETSSSTMTFCLYELAKNQTYQDRVRGEIYKVLENYNGNVTYDSLLHMPYLDQCINETFRKYPVVESLLRIADSDYNVPGSKHVIEKGTIVMIPVYAIQRDPEIYPNPLVFDPERFTTVNIAKRHQFSYLPFGEGPRICLGIRFGMMQIRLGLITILKNYRIHLGKDTPDEIKLSPKSPVLASSKPIKLLIELL